MMIRKASPQDAYGLAEVHSLSSQAAYAGFIDPQFLKTRTIQHSLDVFKQNGCAEVWLAEQAGRIVGFCRIHVEEANGQPLGEIAALYLLPQFQRQGIGRQLMQTGIEQLRLRGCQTIILWVLKTNDSARQFYQRCGFIDDSAEMTMMMGTPQTIVRFRLRDKS